MGYTAMSDTFDHFGDAMDDLNMREFYDDCYSHSTREFHGDGYYQANKLNYNGPFMPFGKYKGWMISNINSSYLEYALANFSRMNIATRRHIESELQRRHAALD